MSCLFWKCINSRAPLLTVQERRPSSTTYFACLAIRRVGYHYQFHLWSIFIVVISDIVLYGSANREWYEWDTFYCRGHYVFTPVQKGKEEAFEHKSKVLFKSKFSETASRFRKSSICKTTTVIHELSLGGGEILTKGCWWCSSSSLSLVFEGCYFCCYCHCCNWCWIPAWQWIWSPSLSFYNIYNCVSIYSNGLSTIYPKIHLDYYTFTLENLYIICLTKLTPRLSDRGTS